MMVMKLDRHLSKDTNACNLGEPNGCSESQVTRRNSGGREAGVVDLAKISVPILGTNVFLSYTPSDPWTCYPVGSSVHPADAGSLGRSLPNLTGKRKALFAKSPANLSRWRCKRQKHTTGGIPRWSPTLVLVARFSAYVWQSGRDAQFSLTYGRMCHSCSHSI
jgi:hypothetical protein